MRGLKLLKSGKKWSRLSELLVSTSQFLICSREECTHTRKHKRKEEKPCTNHEKIYGYKYQLDLGWGQGAWISSVAVYHVYVFLYVCWYFKSKLTSDWLWGHLRSRSFQESEWIISSFSWLRNMGSFFFSFLLPSQHAGLVPCPVCYMLITLVEILFHIIIIIYVGGGERGTVCEWTRLK